MTYKIKVIRLDFKICKQGLVKSYEIKFPPRAILRFKVLDIFSGQVGCYDVAKVQICKQ